VRDGLRRDLKRAAVRVGLPRALGHGQQEWPVKRGGEILVLERSPENRDAAGVRGGADGAAGQEGVADHHAELGPLVVQPRPGLRVQPDVTQAQVAEVVGGARRAVVKEGDLYALAGRATDRQVQEHVWLPFRRSHTG